MSSSRKRTRQLAQQQDESSGSIELLHAAPAPGHIVQVAAVSGLSSPDLESTSVATALRSALRARSSTLPEAWRESASSLSITEIDAFICHLGRNTSAALDAVAANAEGARSRLFELRAVLHAAIDARID